MSKRRERLLALVTVFVTLTIVCGVAEVVLRFLPVSSGLFIEPVTAAHPVFHFRPNRDFVFSRDWDMKLANRGHTNNAGFVNDQDYRVDDPTPLIAVVGDSYIEALMVPYRETVQGRLAAALAGRVRVYSFGASGAPLSQYLVWARYAARTYRSTALVINVVGNDFDESLAAYKEPTGFAAYVRDAAGELRLQLFEWRTGAGGRITSRSALASYLVFNLQAVERGRALWSRLKGQATAVPRYAGNTTAEATPARVNDSLAAIDAFFRDLPLETGLPPDRVAFTLDGFRYRQAAVEGEGTYYDEMRRAFQAKGTALGYEVIDLDPAFFTRHGKTGERFEYPTDGHWNPAGHGIAFEAIMGSRLLKTVTQ